MSVTIGGVTLDTLQAQPLGYEATNTRGGLTARQWEIQGIVTGAQWISLLSVYDTWRNAKILEDPVEASKAVGSAVSFSGTGYGGQTWSSIPCWFSAPPSGSQVGAFVSINFVLVDAVQAVEVVIKEAANADVDDDDVDYGTITLGGVVITLREYPNVFLDTPQLDLTAGGHHYVTGSLVTVEGVQIEGEIIGTAINTLRSWYSTTVTASPVIGQYFPTSPPLFKGFYKLVAGSPVLYYEVSMALAVVL